MYTKKAEGYSKHSVLSCAFDLYKEVICKEKQHFYALIKKIRRTNAKKKTILNL